MTLKGCCSRRKQRAPCRNLWLGGGYHLKKIQCSCLYKVDGEGSEEDVEKIKQMIR